MTPSGQEPQEGRRTGFPSAHSACTAEGQRGERWECSWGALPLQEPGPQAGPQAPCLPASYSEHDFGFICSGVFHEEKHWTFCPRLSGGPGQPRRPQECSQSFHVGLCLHSSALSPLSHLQTERRRVSIWPRSRRPGDRVGHPRSPVPTGGLLGHGSGEGSHPGFLSDSEFRGLHTAVLAWLGIQGVWPTSSEHTAWPMALQTQLHRLLTVPQGKAP